jgi:hypothetical protein
MVQKFQGADHGGRSNREHGVDLVNLIHSEPRMGWFVLTCIFAFFLVACESAPPPPSEQLPMWSLREELSIGSLSGAEREPAFGQVSAVLGTPERGVLVKDAQGPRVYRFSPRGDFLNEIGERGDGPGEFRDVWGLAILPNGTYLLRDSRKGLLLFREDGLALSQRRIPGAYLGNDAISISGGDVLIKEELPQSGIENYWVAPIPVFFRVDTETISIDTLAPLASVDRTGLSWAPYHPRYHLSWLSDGSFVHGSGSDDHLFLVNAGDTTVLTLSRPPDRLPLPGWAHIEIEDHRSWLEDRGNRSAPHLPIPPEELPAFERILISSRDEIWIQRPVAATSGRVSFRMDVFDRDGRPVGYLPIPEGLEVHSVVGDDLWGVRKGEYDEDYVIRFHVVRDPSQGLPGRR